MHQNNHITAVIPAYNEAAAIGHVIAALNDLQNTQQEKLLDQIIVCDNGSTDQTAEIAKAAGATVIHETKPGYGNACLAAIHSIQHTDIVVFVDGDHSIKSEEIIYLLHAINGGADLVIGSRIRSKRETRALTPQQLIGNYIATRLIQWLWQTPVTDLGPFRAIRYQKLLELNMQDQHYGWTTEMQVKAIQAKMRTAEIPVSTLRRIGKSKISGTVTGTIGAAHGILSTIIKLYRLEKRQKLLTKI